MEIRRLTSGDVIAYRDLRLHALQESPTAFASSYEQEARFSLSDFAARLHPNSENAASHMLGAFDDSNRLIGMLGFSRENRPKRLHVGSLWSMYVLPEFRGQSVGSALLDRAIAYAQDLDGLRQLVLSVTAGNVAASALYQSRGFELFGLERDSLCVDGTYFDEEHLLLRLSHTQSQ
ncbi:GNAT family N-acetyltransferase [Nodosilinea sp. LEGE 06152]|uniref:GNAT family N-acetyltransferase n=1 Tax=Nodosilinea sp. LEGE 06152 TaxID=2777966 RepID=UPI001880FC47|nr:GNAT family N-acetyltransferase [Nodosilinea sp. LEGE 06152]MBE9158321.1 GNAT family N-acetyltransferase [Nodosilinea sp. LEGE 06152]